jgi:hypothetical protein
MATMEVRNGTHTHSSPARDVRPQQKMAPHWPRTAAATPLCPASRVGTSGLMGKLGGARRQGIAWPSRRTTAARGYVIEEIPDEILASRAGLDDQHLEATILFPPAE